MENCININVFENDHSQLGISFKSILDDKYDLEKDTNQCITSYSWVDNNKKNYKFNFQDHKREIVKGFSKDALVLNKEEAMIKTENQDCNMVFFLNTVRGYDTFLPVNALTFELQKKYQSSIKKYATNLNINIVIVIINCQYNNLDLINEERDKKLQEEEEESLACISSLKENFKDYVNILDEIYVTPYSQKQYQNDFILQIISTNFSNDIDKEKKVELLNQLKSQYKSYKDNIELSTLKTIANNLESKTILYEPLDLYKQLSNIDFTNIKKIFSNGNKEEKQIQFTKNLNSLYLISIIENNIDTMDWIKKIYDKQHENNNQTIGNEDETILKIEKNYDPYFKFGRIAQTGDLSIFEYEFNEDEFIKSDFSIGSDSCDNTPIGLLISNNHFHLIKWVMENKNQTMSNETQKKWQLIALLSSAFHGKLDIFIYMLTNQSSAIKFDNKAIGYASMNGHCNILKYIVKENLYENGKNVNHYIVDEKKGNMLSIHLAAKNHQKEVFDYLLEIGGIDLDQEDSYGRTPLYFAVQDFKTYSHLRNSTFCDYLINIKHAKTICFIKENDKSESKKIDIKKEIQLNNHSSCAIM